ncbi:MAG: hypothetical protein ACO3EZ_14460 [Prochlorotrichaceae cyanobacterium]
MAQGGLDAPHLILYTLEVNQPTPQPMTYAFTDTVQIDEQWEIPTDLTAALGAIDAAIETAYPYLLPCEVASSGEHDWATELAIQGILEGKTFEEIARSIADEWEPSDHQMMASFGTAWHDGL